MSGVEVAAAAALPRTECVNLHIAILKAGHSFASALNQLKILGADLAERIRKDKQNARIGAVLTTHSTLSVTIEKLQLLKDVHCTDSPAPCPAQTRESKKESEVESVVHSQHSDASGGVESGAGAPPTAPTAPDDSDSMVEALVAVAKNGNGNGNDPESAAATTPEEPKVKSPAQPEPQPPQQSQSQWSESELTWNLYMLDSAGPFQELLHCELIYDTLAKHLVIRQEAMNQCNQKVQKLLEKGGVGTWKEQLTPASDVDAAVNAAVPTLLQMELKGAPLREFVGSLSKDTRRSIMTMSVICHMSYKCHES